MPTLDTIGEHEAIRRLSGILSTTAGVVQGIGDDCAVVRDPAAPASDWVLTSDPVIEGTHFTPATEPRAVGHKALARALSDIAAMGATPSFALVDIAAPGKTQFEWLEELYRGTDLVAQRFSCPILGGDLARAGSRQIHVFAAGRVPRGSAVLRSGAGTGQALCVTGLLGGSALGGHLDFEPRVREGVWLRENRYADAMIDLSDGLARDAANLALCSNALLSIDSGAIPFNEQLDTETKLEHALYDGEDFELLFTIQAELLPEMQKEWRKNFDIQCTRIGEVIEGTPGILLDRKPVELKEFRHFKA